MEGDEKKIKESKSSYKKNLSEPKRQGPITSWTIPYSKSFIFGHNIPEKRVILTWHTIMKSLILEYHKPTDEKKNTVNCKKTRQNTEQPAQTTQLIIPANHTPGQQPSYQRKKKLATWKLSMPHKAPQNKLWNMMYMKNMNIHIL